MIINLPVILLSGKRNPFAGGRHAGLSRENLLAIRQCSGNSTFDIDLFEHTAVPIPKIYHRQSFSIRIPMWIENLIRKSLETTRRACVPSGLISQTDVLPSEDSPVKAIRLVFADQLGRLADTGKAVVESLLAGPPEEGTMKRSHVLPLSVLRLKTTVFPSGEKHGHKSSPPASEVRK